MESFQTFGQMLSYLRERERLSQRELARAVGYSDAQISRLEKGQRTPDPTVVAARFVQALHLEGEPEVAARLVALARQANARRSAPDTERAPEVAGPAISPMPPRRTHNLPAPATSLIGRDADLAAALGLLERDDVRLVTLIGPPGVGKTRLALAVAWAAREAFADGAWFVPLAGVDDPRDVAATIVEALELPDASVPADVLLRHHLRDKCALLLLDNFEQLLGNSDDSDAAVFLAELLASAPGCKVLMTSRTALRVQGERLVDVQPLVEVRAVELFAQRAQAVRSGFALTEVNAPVVAEICRRLDGLPLAIELAAARARLFDPPQLLARLSSRLDVLTDGVRDLPPRQRTLQRTIEWSYDLLTPDEQTLFRRLGVFAGGCSLEAAERVAGTRLASSVFDLVQALSDKSMIRLDVHDGETRIALLETLREFAVARLTASGEASAVAKQHADYYVGLFESVPEVLSHLEPLKRVWWLDREEGNWRAAMAYARRVGDATMLLRIVVAPMTDRFIVAPEAEEWGWLPELLDASRETASPLLHARALRSCARLVIGTSASMRSSREWLEESVTRFHELGESFQEAVSLLDLTNLDFQQGEYALGRIHANLGLELAEQVDHEALRADFGIWLGASVRDQGEFEAASALFARSLTHYRKLKLIYAEGLVYNGLGDLEYSRGDNAAAEMRYAQARDVWQKWGGPNAEFASRGLGRIAYARGELARADGLLSTCVEALHSWRDFALLGWTLHHLGIAKHLMGDSAAATELLRAALTGQHQKLMRLNIAESLERLAWIAADLGRPERAGKLFGAADALRKWMGAPLPLGDKPLYDKFLAMARAALDSDAFGRAWAAGAAMSLDEAVAYALGE